MSWTDDFNCHLQTAGEAASYHGVLSKQFSDACQLVIFQVERAILEDRAAQLDSKRQEFLDRAAIRIYARGGTSAVTACDWSEALWVEREKRRLAKAEEAK